MVLDDGSRQVLKHPREAEHVMGLTGKDLDLLCQEGKVFMHCLRDYLCLSCGEVSLFDEFRDNILCPKCHSNELKPANEMQDVLCPECKQGTLVRTGYQVL